MKHFIGFILGILLTFTVVGCAALTSAPSMVASGMTIYQSAKQLSGIAKALSTSATTAETSNSCTQDATLAEKMEGYAKWADTIAKAAAEIEAGIKKKE